MLFIKMPGQKIEKQTTQDPAIAATVHHYKQAGWTVIPTGRGVVNIIAHKNVYKNGKAVESASKLHFVKVRTAADVVERPTVYAGGERGSFVQNAYSNEAVPTYATYDGKKVTFLDADRGKRLLVTADNHLNLDESSQKE